MCPALSKLRRHLSVTVAAAAGDNGSCSDRSSFVVRYIMQNRKGTLPGLSASVPEDLLVAVVQPEDAVLLYS